MIKIASAHEWWEVLLQGIHVCVLFQHFLLDKTIINYITITKTIYSFMYTHIYNDSILCACSCDCAHFLGEQQRVSLVDFFLKSIRPRCFESDLTLWSSSSHIQTHTSTHTHRLDMFESGLQTKIYYETTSNGKNIIACNCMERGECWCTRVSGGISNN